MNFLKRKYYKTEDGIVMYSDKKHLEQLARVLACDGERYSC